MTREVKNEFEYTLTANEILQVWNMRGEERTFGGDHICCKPDLQMRIWVISENSTKLQLTGLWSHKKLNNASLALVNYGGMNTNTYHDSDRCHAK